MKTSIKILSLLALALVAGGAVGRAQDNSTPPPDRERPRMKEMRAHRIKELDEKLHLTADQKVQIKAIWDKAEQQAKAQRDAAASANEDRREKRREAMLAVRQQVRAVLTPDQQKAFDEMPQRNGPPAKGDDGK